MGRDPGRGAQHRVWLWLNADEPSALARAQTIAHALPAMPDEPHALALDALATLHEDRGQFAAAAEDYLGAAALFQNPRFIWGAGVDLWAAGRPEEAQAQFRRAAGNAVFRAKLLRANERNLRRAPDEPILLAMHRALVSADGGAAGDSAAHPTGGPDSAPSRP